MSAFLFDVVSRISTPHPAHVNGRPLSPQRALLILFVDGQGLGQLAVDRDFLLQRRYLRLSSGDAFSLHMDPYSSRPKCGRGYRDCKSSSSAATQQSSAQAAPSDQPAITSVG